MRAKLKKKRFWRIWMNDFQFGNYLYEKRTEKGLSQAELGAMLGVSNKAVSKWESGAAKPQTAKLLRLAEILGVSVEDLLSGGRTEAAKQVQDDPQRSIMIEQWMRTCRLAKIFAWLLVGGILQIPFVAIFLIVILNVSDDVGAAYVLCTMLLLITAAILTAAYGISQKKQRRMILRLWAVDPALPPADAHTADEVDTENQISAAFRYQLLRLERMTGRLLLVWLILAAIPIFAYISIFALSYIISGWDALLYVVFALYVGFFTWVITLPVYTLVSVIVYLVSRTRLFSAHRQEYLAYRQKKRTATKKHWSTPLAVPLYFVMLVLSAVRLFFVPTPLIFWIAAALFALLFGTAIVALSILTHRLAKQMAALMSDADTQF
ncbi:MAG: helix-turn-helix transcriptional regulator [Ruminococcaceae bacterium]|nr:helix-turn-helix transcriptional regulator [Oscillospiraceae bacterium]